MCLWKKVEDEKPIDGQGVIAYSKRDGINYEVEFHYDNLSMPLWRRNGRCNMEDVTYWMDEIKRPSQSNFFYALLCAGLQALTLIADYYGIQKLAYNRWRAEDLTTLYTNKIMLEDL